MGTVNARDLSRRTASILDEVTATGRPWLVLRRGQPVAALVAIDPDELEDWVLANAPAFVRSMRQADADLQAGRVHAVDAVFAELDAEEGATTPRAPAAGRRRLAPAAAAAAPAARSRRGTKPPTSVST
jgi:antitoxin (DNA-binding transcriptional repressor) of toxin-antitoxin stability system